ncbi:MAG: hypothetical protein WAW06_09025 [bacterium]
MSCPFATRCAGFEVFSREEDKMHLAWAFCLGEYHDCDRYKTGLAGGEVATTGEAGDGAAARDELLSKLRARLIYRRQQDR